MKNLYTVERMAENRSYYNFKMKTAAGESLTVEIMKCFDPGGKSSLPAMWHKNGWTAERLKEWWSVAVYATDEGGTCRGGYNPQSKPNGCLDFNWIFPATEENKNKLLDEIARRAGIKTEG